MKTMPIPALVAATAALFALPFSFAAAGTLLFTAALGSIIHADYVLRQQRLPLPRRQAVRRRHQIRSPFGHERHPLAA